VPGFSVSPVVAAGVLGVVGYLLGGTRGGAAGALLGGAGAYFMRQRAAPAPAGYQQGEAITGGLKDLPWYEGAGGQLYDSQTHEPLVDEKGMPVVISY
jgi:hypothetical protein